MIKEIDDHPIDDWKYEVQNGDTQLGYLAWVNAREEAMEQHAYSEWKERFYPDLDQGDELGTDV